MIIIRAIYSSDDNNNSLHLNFPENNEEAYYNINMF